MMYLSCVKVLLLLGRFMKPYAQNLSCEYSCKEMVASNEDCSDWNEGLYDGLDGDEILRPQDIIFRN